ncbi:MAG: hypothetical protein A2W91_16795 [Bacteroidetes bacterium GWF2_38_335]|nr:MAG: hypothetical protein A2W91_16795 [Bacteroidetes bacterium GWF2_38_335]OFY81343.1 MAG: hypothetical protein A2281_07770 [Bacteroidetes bacterium RIFOXYA12_FULL_38_20]HBS85465.1 hypothetical protein [Bacteroidales bacterium]
MTIQELKVTSHIMSILFDFEKSYQTIAEKEFGKELQKADCKLILKFLNDWGCRQFKIEDHDKAAKDFIEWHEKAFDVLPDHSLSLIYEKDNKIKQYGEIFDLLKEKFASESKNGVKKTFGPVGAAKTLFALRKNMFPPWDNPIIKDHGYSYDGNGYTKYLKRVKKELLIIKEECGKNNFKIEQLPSELKSKQSSLVKIIDEYFWLTITRGFDPKKIISLINER